MTGEGGRISRTVETRHGPIDYETVICSNCDQTVLSESAVPVAVGGSIENYYESTSRIRVRGDHIEAATLCSHCAESVFGYEYAGSLSDGAFLGTFLKLANELRFWLPLVLMLGSALALPISARLWAQTDNVLFGAGTMTSAVVFVVAIGAVIHELFRMINQR